MKRHLSVWMLLNRITLLPLLAVCTACTGGQILLFEAGLKAQSFLAEKSLENAVTYSRIPLAAAAGFVLVLALCVFGCSAQQTEHTVRRLRISRSAFCVWHAVHTAACLLVFWAVQLGAVLFCAGMYINRFDPNGTQTVFLAFWRQPWLHSLLPVLDPLRWVRNLLLLAALAFSAADLARRLRGGGRGYWLPVLAAAVLCLFSGAADALARDVILGLLSAAAVWSISAGWYTEEHTKENADEEA